MTKHYSPRPPSIIVTRALSASSSSSPSQVITISSPHFTHAPSTLSTLFAFAVFSPYEKVIKDLQQNKKEEDDELDSFKNNIYVVFVECETPGNIGFLARTMANFGLKNLVLINPPKLTPEAFYQATHGKYIVENALTYPSLDEFYQSKRIDFKIYCSSKLNYFFFFRRLI